MCALYVVGVTILWQCVSLIEWNAWDDEWLVFIKDLQEKKKVKKEFKIKIKNDLVCE
jgi:hypothetical protein